MKLVNICICYSSTEWLLYTELSDTNKQTNSKYLYSTQRFAGFEFCNSECHETKNQFVCAIKQQWLSSDDFQTVGRDVSIQTEIP